MLNSLKSLIAYRDGRRMNQRIGNKMNRGRKNIEEGIKKEITLDRQIGKRMKMLSSPTHSVR